MGDDKIGAAFEHLLFNDLIDNIPIGVMILDRQGRIIRMSRRQEQISQIPRAEVIGKFFHEAFPKTLEQGLTRSYWRLLRRLKPFDIRIDRYVPQYYSKVMTYRARGAYLPTTDCFILLHELEEELYHVKRLVEQRTKQLESSNAFLESLINSSPNIVISTDLRDRIVIFNDTAERSFQYRRSEVTGHSVCHLISPSKLKSRAFLPISDQGEVTCLRKDGTSFPASLSFSYIADSRGRRLGKLYIFSDLTEKKAMEERLSISEKLALYSELMGGIAHQINNPMIGVVNFAEMLVAQLDEGDVRRQLAQTIYKAGRECLQIISSVLSCLKNPRLTFCHLSLNKLLRQVLHHVRERYLEELQNIELALNFSRDLPDVRGDSLQLRQCFLNILANAVEAMDGRPGRLSVHTMYDIRRHLVKVSITDTGRGISRENVERIFLPFYSWPRRQGHHGLGLSFAYHIVQNHGGQIEVQSKPGAGTTVVVALPTISEEGQ